MDFSDIPLVSAIAHKMSWLTARQKTIAANVANNDTPGYKATDLKPIDFSKELANVSRSTGINIGGPGIPAAPQLEAAMTAPNDIRGTILADDESAKPNKPIEDRSINGNTGSMEDEMMKASSTAADYQMMTELYQKQVSMFDTALDKGGI
jgi:flagellar basal-body rod protein FlgB